MLHDAIEGFRLSKSINHRQLSLLQQRLETRIEAQQVEKNTFFFTGQRLAIASVAGMLLIVFSVLFWMMNTSRVADQEAAKLETQQSGAVVQLQEKASSSLISGSIIPEDGWSSLRDYLSVNGTKIAMGEKVRLHVEVENGRPQNIKVLSSSSEQVTAEIIRLLQDGPSWNGE